MLFPPEGTSGAGSPPEGTAASTPPVGGSSPPAGASPPTSDTKPFATPADDWEKRYGEVEAKLKPWQKYGDPDQVEEALNWARARAAEIQAGKLRMVEDQPPSVNTSSDEPADWDDMTSAQQREWYRADSRKAMQAERLALKQELEAPLKHQLQTIGMQQQIWMQATEMSREYGIPFQDAMAESMRIAQLDSTGLLKLAFENKANPARTEKEIERRVNEALAKRAQEAENADLALLNGRGAPRFATEPAKDRTEQRQNARMSVLRTIRDQVRNRGTGAA